MKQSWEFKQLGDICNIVNGGTPKSSISEYWNGNNLWITPKDMSKLSSIFVDDTARKITDQGLQDSSAKLLPEYSLILSSRAPIGYLAINTKPISTNQGCKGVIPSNKINYLYLYYFLKKSVKLLNELGTGATFKELSSTKLNSVSIPIPSIEIQKEIVAKLDQIFAAIDTAKINIEKNLENSKELFQSKLNEIFSPKGDGWIVKKLGEISNVTYGFTENSVDTGDYRYIRITDIGKNGELLSTGKKYINHSVIATAFILKENDIVMARTGATFAKLLLYKDLEPSIFASYLIKIDFTENISNELYWFYAKSSSYWRQANALSSGAAQPHFNGQALKEVIFSYPESSIEQKSLVENARRFQSQIQSLESKYQKELDSLEELKKSILEKAFTGEL